MAHPYQAVADDILLRIRRGEWKHGERIPAVRALEALYPHSRMTLHKALRHLQQAGYLSAVHGRGTFVKAARIKDAVAILAGGQLGEHSFSPLSTACVDHARAYFTRLGFDARVYTETPLTPSRLPAALLDDLDAGKLKGLLTVLSTFAFKHLGTDAWNRHRVPHVDIGSQPAPQRVYVDFNAFYRRALALAAADGRRQPLLVATGSGMPPAAVRDLYQKGNVRVHVPDPEAPPAANREEWGFRLMRDLLRGRAEFDCLIVPEDNIAKGLAQGALAYGARVPDRFAIIALVNRGIELFYPVPVIQLQLDVESLVIHAGERLLQLLHDPDLPPSLALLPPDREVRYEPEAARLQEVP